MGRRRERGTGFFLWRYYFPNVNSKEKIIAVCFLDFREFVYYSVRGKRTGKKYGFVVASLESITILIRIGKKTCDEAEQFKLHCFCSSCRPLQDKFVALLRLLLLWDPTARGGSKLESGKIECFDMLERIISSVVNENFVTTLFFKSVGVN